MKRILPNCRIALRYSIAIAILCVGGAAKAQSPADYEYTTPPDFYQPAPPQPVENGFSQLHSSTAGEGFQRGTAAVIQSMGNFRLSATQAAILGEQARAQNRENDLKQTEALVAQQAMWREARYAERAEFDARRAAGRAKIEERYQTVHRTAYQLSPHEFNAVTGEIRWPGALQSEKFRAERTRMEELIRQHVEYGDPSSVAEIARLSKTLARSLRSEIGALPKDDYVTAQKFLLGLRFEVS